MRKKLRKQHELFKSATSQYKASHPECDCCFEDALKTGLFPWTDNTTTSSRLKLLLLMLLIAYFNVGTI